MLNLETIPTPSRPLSDHPTAVAVIGSVGAQTFAARLCEAGVSLTAASVTLLEQLEQSVSISACVHEDDAGGVLTIAVGELRGERYMSPELVAAVRQLADVAQKAAAQGTVRTFVYDEYDTAGGHFEDYISDEGVKAHRVYRAAQAYLGTRKDFDILRKAALYLEEMRAPTR